MLSVVFECIFQRQLCSILPTSDYCEIIANTDSEQAFNSFGNRQDVSNCWGSRYEGTMTSEYTPKAWDVRVIDLYV